MARRLEARMSVNEIAEVFDITPEETEVVLPARTLQKRQAFVDENRG
jgi:hypothetical protein